MKKILLIVVACLAITLTACSDSPAKRVDKMKAMYDEMYEMAEKYGVDNDSVLNKFSEIENFNATEIIKDYPEWSQEERDYYAKINGECVMNPLYLKIASASSEQKSNDSDFGKRPEDSDLEKAVDQAKDAANQAKDAAGNAVDEAKNAADNAKNAADNAIDKVKGAAKDL